MLRKVALVLLWCAGTLLASSPAWADRRIALVVGNGAYTHAAPLANPAHDARAVAAAMERLGFEVVSGIDLGNAELRKVVRSFADRLGGADVALFFYAGHGLQVSGENYLIPVDAAIHTETDLDFNAVKIDLVSRQMDRQAKVKIIILDACRDNPFEKELARSMGSTRSATVKQGLAEISNAGGTLIAFATHPGAVALDGAGRHSPFTSALLKHIETPGVEIGLVMRRVTRDVYEATNERQRPWTNASLTGELYLKPGEAPVQPPTMAPAPAADERQIELALWQTVEKGGQAADFEEYLKQYPQGRFAGVARNRLAVQRKAAEEKAQADADARRRVEEAAARDRPATGSSLNVAPDPVAARAALVRGNEWLNQRNWQRAIAEYDLAIALDRTSKFAFMNRGSARYGFGDFPRAIQDYSEALRLDTRYAAAFYARGIAYRKIGRAADANADMNAARAIDPRIERFFVDPIWR